MNWNRYYLGLAEAASRKSKQRTCVGAVIVRPNNTIVSTGFNGFPRGMEGDEEVRERDDKLSRTIHAELNALLTAGEFLEGYKMYIWPGLSCDRCTVHIIQAGIKTVIYPDTYEAKDFNKRWADSMEKSLKYFEECGVEVQCL